MSSSIKAFYCLLIFGAVVCQNGDLNPLVEGSGSGEVDGGSTMSTTPVTKVITRKPEDTIIEAGSGDDEDGKIIMTTKPNATVLTMSTRPIDGEGSGDVSGDGNEMVVTEPTMPAITWRIKTQGFDTSSRNVPSSENTNEIKTNPGSEKTTLKFQTTESTYVASTKAEGKKPSTKATTMAKDPMTDVEIIHSPTSKAERRTKMEATSTSNVIVNPTEDPLLAGNTAKSRGRDSGSKVAISFTTGIIIGVIVGVLLAVIVILLLVYRLRKKDEGSYSLEEPITGYVKQDQGSAISDKEYFA